ncbi:WD repeat-containing protein 88-like isoform X2 [Notolabrus celidotus]|uniref:WD repeat-containing protein 88-like isoform X2 n=1 Tax=Notolabrus celidotus TaxID=1203425 RepID=UPI0014903B12|nr:WD repeat-containing protein 88-like isoform X2 [Notolabrus celidotus]
MTTKTIDPLSVKDPPGGEEGSEETEEEERSGGERSRETQVPFKVLKGHSDTVTAAQLCFNDSRVLSCSSDRSAILWNIESCRPLRVFDGLHSKNITECAVIPNSNRMVTVSWDKEMVVTDLETGQTVWRCRLVGLLTSCSSSSDGRLLVCAADPQNSIYILDAAGGETLHHVGGHHRSTITRCRFDLQSQRVATVSADRRIKLWDLQSRKTTLSIDSNHNNVVSDCCFTNNGHFLCTASWDKSLKLWDLHAGGFRSHGGTSLQRSHESSVSSCSFSTDDLLVSGSYDRTVALWDMSTLCQTLILKGHTDCVTDVSVSTDKKLVASASKDCTVRLWNIENMEEIPEVVEKRAAEGAGNPILKCEECGKPFPVCRLQTSDLLTQCFYCRLKEPSRHRPQPPPLT